MRVRVYANVEDSRTVVWPCGAGPGQTGWVGVGQGRAGRGVPGTFLRCSWVIFSWNVPGTFLGRSWNVPYGVPPRRAGPGGVFLGHSCDFPWAFFPVAFLECSWDVPWTFLGRSWDVPGTFWVACRKHRHVEIALYIPCLPQLVVPQHQVVVTSIAPVFQL